MQSKAPISRLLVILTALFTALSGIYLSGGGIWLISIGGSLYYLLAGIVLLLTAWLLYRRNAISLLLYAVFLLATLVWSVWEVGFDFWALTPRLDVLFFLGVWLILPFIAKAMVVPNAAARGALSAVLLITVLALGWAVFHDPQEINGTLATADNASAPASDSSVPPGDWPAYGRTQAGTRYSPLSQIDDKNVKDLQVAWTFRTGDLKTASDPGEITDEVTPIKIADALYLCSPHQKLFALDAATGKQKWVFDPGLKTNPTFQHVTCRGVSYHEDKAALNAAADRAPALCARRILLPVNDGRLYALDAETGARCPNFANNGELDLQSNMPYATPGAYEPTSPPVVTDKVIVVAGAVTDNYSTKEPSGVIRGFDVNSGKLLWAFDPGAKDPNVIPEGEQHYVPNSPNAWAPAAYDEKLDLVYLPMGVATPDIWGGYRSPEMERFASGILALNATTGKLAWFYQTVHHDLWDMDVPAQPTLADIEKDGQTIPVIYAPAKTGNIFVLDRRSGKLVVGAPEKAVPQGAAKGDYVSASQPFSDLSFRPKNNLSGKDMWGATLYDQLVCRVMFHRLRYEGIFTPPSEQGTLVFPGNLGMFEWGGISVNTDRQLAIANPIALPFVSRLIPRGPGNPIEPDENSKGGSGSETGIQPQYGVPYGVTLNPFLSPFGLPCKQPAWGYISGVDLKTHLIVWKKRIGTVRDSSPLPLPFKMGMPMLGGPVSTAGNVFFIAATADNYLRAFNVSNGKQLWQARLPAGGQATPMTYEVNGKQYVVIAAGGHGSFGTKLGDYVIAYALPDSKQ
ncbi:pyrroloquinoline quinone-dependent dehydrogenase [Erwinia sp. OLTSP20]|uniref:glucose/quinate/shikimate family membrane-bound PQQ-dependent dehydrogenase n=1 Tax=unclassified Erwinia TaxID=2622719 RepID=UPI000C176027|nr:MULTISPECIES: glucose/quinate/shikimate family membrane-bound PQQ-dependent dehydrogenase [unclassified Erwinia]PIJ51179.1 membrane-bound PQQ-dependent dehydrogenase, glucose/quinate/shikimate family [Erwinia sp. OAMSP11]PIJ73931.1 pyrroloquinoline quinone-dependent dehydrogenase [Erwinia sp. OLSSP12]PIJ83939.1 pyrroloquinoline quinone-dependent dehydrogenase [Erwinia sp. OLCASP19]PIJ86469.1 pyrroloquinoline quinone-dependent dehydrogenase [Erwinia sp. OLMTSP26]PIJ87948.1 pyrroloquinoline q